MDLMDMVKGAVGKQVLAQIGGMLGTDEKKTSSVFEMASGSILGGLIKKAGSADGTREVFEMAGKQDEGILDKLGDILGGGDEAQEELQKSGGGILDGIFGSSQTGMLETLAKALGLDGDRISKLLKMIAPIIMGVVAKHIKSKAMDAGGLGKFLGEQKKSLGFMPSSLTDSLGFGDLGLSNVTDAGKAAAGAAVGAVSGAAKDMSKSTGDAAQAGGGLVKLLLPLLILAALLFVGWKYLLPMVNGGVDNVRKGTQQVNQGLKDAAKNKIPSLDTSSIPGFEMTSLGTAGPELVKGFGDITTGMNGLNDSGEDGAKTLAGKITEFTGTINGLGLADLPEAGKKSASGLIEKFIETITGLLDGQNDGIKGILEPVIDALKDKLTGALG